MWLPSSIYESLPALYVSVGLLFVAGALYLGFMDVTMPYYMAIGIGSILSGVFVQYRRMKVRRVKAAAKQEQDTHHDHGGESSSAG